MTNRSGVDTVQSFLDKYAEGERAKALIAGGFTAEKICDALQSKEIFDAMNARRCALRAAKKPLQNNETAELKALEVLYRMRDISAFTPETIKHQDKYKKVITPKEIKHGGKLGREWGGFSDR